MWHRFLTAGLLCTALALGGLLARRAGGDPLPPPAPVARTAPAEPPTDDGFVEIRFRLPRGVTPKAPNPSAGQGTLVNTGNPFDLAIDGAGFLQVTLPDGELRYTRNGALRLNAQGNLVTTDGYLIMPQISIPPTAAAATIGSDGTVSMQNAGAPNATTVLGQLALVRFVNPGGLALDRDRLFRETELSGAPIIGTPGQNGLGLTRQGFLENTRDQMVARLLDLLRQLGDEEGPRRVHVRAER
jgi:flagellar basal-body rod protein FlgG